ncbi:MAG: L-threonylcarbamoyladenylate synthase [Atopobiaceae bacterium]|jgi:tRNA threonylcarbamoyl adenosine modification protein (Sua5/YciO/YrdC/YwlC family)|nr:L-threonylcarbamoyladenylate synthase [Atopobiaceae bacterium]
MGRIVAVDQDEPQVDVLERAARVLRDGGVLVMPTDSVYGIGCAAIADNPGHRRIFSIKRRELSQTLPWLVADPSDLLKYGRDVPAWMELLAQKLWPGALTLVVVASDLVPKEYCAANGTIALRVPDSELVRSLVRMVGPLATTSANTHGEAAATSGVGVEERIVREADLTLDAGPAPLAVASTIVGCEDGELRVYRDGAIPTSCIVEAVASLR